MGGGSCFCASGGRSSIGDGARAAVGAGAAAGDDNAAAAQKVQSGLERALDIRARIIFLAPGALAVPAGKRVVRVTDRRTQ